MMNITKPGIYKGLSNEIYHASDGLSSSKLGDILPPYCPEYYWYKHLSGEYIKPQTEAFTLGSVVHTLVFEPEKFNSQFYVVNEIPKRNTTLGKTAYEGMVANAQGRLILERSEYNTAYKMMMAVQTHKMWIAVKGNNTGCIEDSLAWYDDESGVLLRSRPDFYTDEIIIDLKTTKDSSPHAFSKSVLEYGYHRQAAMAIDGLTKLTGREYKSVILFVVDKNPPHFTRCYVIKDSAVEQGRYEYKYAARKFADCMNTQVWDGYAEIIEELDIPSWAYRYFCKGLNK